MRGFAIFAAFFAALVSLTPGTARAYQPTPLTTGVGLLQSAGVADRWDRDRRWDRGRDWRRDRRWRGNDRRWRGRDRRWRGRDRWRTVCRTQWRNGYRQRVCRPVRYR